MICRCGNIGCLEAIAGGQALAARLAATGAEASNSRDVVRLVRDGNAAAMRMVRDAGRTLGEVLAGTVNFFNPAVIVIGGDIAEAHAQLLAGVREGIFSRSLPLATRDLRIVPCRLGRPRGRDRSRDNGHRARAVTGRGRSNASGGRLSAAGFLCYGGSPVASRAPSGSAKDWTRTTRPSRRVKSDDRVSSTSSSCVRPTMCTTTAT